METECNQQEIRIVRKLKTQKIRNFTADDGGNLTLPHLKN